MHKYQQLSRNCESLEKIEKPDVLVVSFDIWCTPEANFVMVFLASCERMQHRFYCNSNERMFFLDLGFWHVCIVQWMVAITLFSRCKNSCLFEDCISNLVILTSYSIFDLDVIQKLSMSQNPCLKEKFHWAKMFCMTVETRTALFTQYRLCWSTCSWSIWHLICHSDCSLLSVSLL